LRSPWHISILRNGVEVTKARFLIALMSTATAVGLTSFSWCQGGVSQPAKLDLPTVTRDYGEAAKPGSAPTYAKSYDVLPSPRRSSHFSGLVMDFAQDQKQIWTSPARVRLSDLNWLAPLGGLTAGLFVTDRQYSASLSQNPSTLKNYKNLSDAGLAALVGMGAGMYLGSFAFHNDHWRETGFLAGEAVLNSLVTVEAFKYSLGRLRPYQGNGSGAFFSGGTSFPSEHAAASWAVAGVIAHEYPGILPKLFAYGTASVVSYSRIHARQHFPSDVLVGSVLGYLVAQDIYSRRHDPELGGRHWAAPGESLEENSRSPANMGSPYVPLESWIYPALVRLTALGYTDTAILGLRPWTRLECARLVSEAAERHPAADAPPEVAQLYASLSQEFAYEFQLISGDQNRHTQVESVYTRSMAISGPPLTDNYHFGQTLVNDYGRPFERGFNSASGVSGWTSLGPFVLYARGEYQSAPSAPAPSQAVLNFISSADGLPPNAPSTPIAATSRFRLLDAYVGMTFANWEFSFGKQSLWWGPSEGGTMLFTNNIEPLNKMFRITRVSPFRLPSFLGLLGDIRTEFFLGQLSGHEFINTVNFNLPPVFVGQYGRALNPQPFLSGAKISFKFTQNSEFSMSETAVCGGPGNPLTLGTLFKCYLAIPVNGDSLGDGRTAIDFTYRIPKLRNWMTLYGDMFEEDEPSPIGHPEKAVFQGGLYLPKLPKISRLDLRVEGGSTSPVDFHPEGCNGCFYWNFQYLNSYTNNGDLIGTWIGRAAQGELVRTNYWLGPQRKIGIEYRHRKIDRAFIPAGGTQNDVAVNADFFVKSGLCLSGMVQYERWQIPLLASGSQSNVTAFFQLSLSPRVHAR